MFALCSALFLRMAERWIHYILEHGVSHVQRRKPLIGKDLLYFSGKQKNIKVFHIGTHDDTFMDTAPGLKILFSPLFHRENGLFGVP